jgi:hypothetical protein
VVTPREEDQGIDGEGALGGDPGGDQTEEGHGEDHAGEDAGGQNAEREAGCRFNGQ